MFWTKRKNPTTTKQKSNIKPLPEPGNEQKADALPLHH